MKIEIKNLNFGYNSKSSVINNLDLTINGGSITSIVGVSGSGKTTLLHLIAGLIQKHAEHNFEGLISIDGISPIEFRKSGRLSFMFQEPALMPNLSVFENISFPIQIKKLGTSKNEIYEVIESVGLSLFKNYLPKSLSGGMKTRVALARSFITYPALLLLDEPFAALDIAWRHELYDELKMFRERFNTTVLFVTHDIDEALLLSDEILVLGIGGNVIKKFNLNGDRINLYEKVYKTIIDDHKEKYTSNNEA